MPGPAQRNPFAEGLELGRVPAPSTLVIFGTTGDLTARKLLPSLYMMQREGILPPGFSLVGFGRRPWDHVYFREYVHEAATIVVSLRTVGVALVAAMLVTPPAAAYLLTRRLPGMMLVSALIGIISAIGGLYASYYLNVATGGAMGRVATAIFVLVFLFAPERGVVWRLGRGRLA